MKKLLLLVAMAMLSVTSIYAQSGWVTYKADDRISVKFPIAPKDLQPGTVMAAPDSTSIFILTVVDFTQFGLDSVALAPMKNSTEFTGQIKTGMLQSLPGVELADFKIATWKGFTTYTTSGSDTKKKNYDIYMVLVGNKMYSLTNVRSGGVPVKGRDDFFA